MKFEYADDQDRRTARDIMNMLPEPDEIKEETTMAKAFKKAILSAKDRFFIIRSQKNKGFKHE
jgi:hypothetical protein